MSFKFASIDDRRDASDNLRRVLTALGQSDRVSEYEAGRIRTENELLMRIDALASERADLVVLLDLHYDPWFQESSVVVPALEEYSALLASISGWELMQRHEVRQGIGAGLLLAQRRNARARTLLVVNTTHEKPRLYAKAVLSGLLEAAQLRNASVIPAACAIADPYDEVGSYWEKEIGTLIANGLQQHFPERIPGDDNGRLGTVLQALRKVTDCEGQGEKSRWTHEDLDSFELPGVQALAEVFGFEARAFDTNLAKALMQCGRDQLSGVCCYLKDENESPWFRDEPKPIPRDAFVQVLARLGISRVTISDEFITLPVTPGLPFLFALTVLRNRLLRQANEEPSICWRARSSAKGGIIEILLSQRFPAFGLKEQYEAKKARGEDQLTGVSLAVSDFCQGRISAGLEGDDPLAKLFRAERLSGRCISDPLTWSAHRLVANWGPKSH